MFITIVLLLFIVTERKPMSVLLEKLRGLFFSSSNSAAANEKRILPSYIRNEDADTQWLTSDLIGDGAYGKIYKVYDSWHIFVGC